MTAYNVPKGCGLMERSKKGSRLASLVSGLCVLAALMLLLLVCGYCYPSMQDTCREVLGGMEDGAVQQAFNVLADGLQNGEPVKETFSQSMEILFHEKG